MNATYGNITSSLVHQLHPNWTFLLIIKTCIMILSICLNAGVTVYHLASPSQVTSFSLYLVSLYMANILYCTVVTPMQIISELYGTWWMGRSACIFYNYFEVVASLPAVMFHTLIAINRIWAISHPVSYRMYHNKRTARFLCLVSLFYVHIIELPGLILDALYYHLPERERGCLVNYPRLAVWARIQNALCRIFPLLLIMFAYAYTNVLIWHRRRRRPDNTFHNSLDTNPRSATTNKISALQNQADKEHHGEEGVASVTRNREVKASLVLTLTAISVTVCWLPADALYFAFLFFGIGFSSTAFTTVMVLYSVQTLFDPLMLVFSLRRSAYGTLDMMCRSPTGFMGPWRRDDISVTFLAKSICVLLFCVLLFCVCQYRRKATIIR